MKNNAEIWGLRLELVGLVVLLVGTMWQGAFSDTWRSGAIEWQYYIESEVDQTLLESIALLAGMSATENMQSRDEQAQSIRKRVAETTILTERNRDQREEAIQGGQATVLWNVERYIILLGAALIIIGKWVALHGVKVRTKVT